MKWLPPRSMAARAEWANVHPWLAGFYGGLFFSALSALTFPAMIRRSIWLLVLVGLLTWLASGLIFAVGLKRGWGERPDAKNHPAPTLLRLWTRVSDRLLLWIMLLGAAAALTWAGELITGSARAWEGALGLSVSVWVASTTWAERKRRQSSG